jgi:hypothetical protein
MFRRVDEQIIDTVNIDEVRKSRVGYLIPMRRAELIIKDFSHFLRNKDEIMLFHYSISAQNRRELTSRNVKIIC